MKLYLDYLAAQDFIALDVRFPVGRFQGQGV